MTIGIHEVDREATAGTGRNPAARAGMAGPAAVASHGLRAETGGTWRNPAECAGNARYGQCQQCRSWCPCGLHATHGLS